MAIPSSSAETDKWHQSADISVDAFATFINDNDNVPGFESLNNSNFFDQVGNASKLFDGENSTHSLKTAATHHKKKAGAAAPRHIKRKTTPNSFPSPYMEQPTFYLEEGIDEEGMGDDEGGELEKTLDEALGAFLEQSAKTTTKETQQDEPVADSKKSGNDVDSVSTAVMSLSSTEGSNSDSSVSKKYSALSQAGEATVVGQDQEPNVTPVSDGESAASGSTGEGQVVSDATKRALALAGVVNEAEEAVQKEKTKSLKKRNSHGKLTDLPQEEGVTKEAKTKPLKKRSSHGKLTDLHQEGHQEEGVTKETTLETRRISDGSRKKKVSREMNGEESEVITPERRKNSRGTGAAGSKPRQRRAEADRSGSDHSRRERRSPVKPNNKNEESTINSRRSQRFRDQRSRSFGPESTKEAANNDGDVGASSPKASLKRTKTLPSKHPNSVELRRVTRDPRRSRRATLGSEMLARNLSLMDQAAESLGEKTELDPSASMNKSPKGGKEKQQTWKARRQRSFGDATDALAEKAKNAALERLARKGSIQSAAAALTTGAVTPKVISQQLRCDVGSAMDRILLAGLDNRKTNEQASAELKTDKTTGEAAIKDDSCVPRTPLTPSGPSAVRRIRRRGSCS